eukprot:Opistho-2@2557
MCASTSTILSEMVGEFALASVCMCVCLYFCCGADPVYHSLSAWMALTSPTIGVNHCLFLVAQAETAAALTTAPARLHVAPGRSLPADEAQDAAVVAGRMRMTTAALAVDPRGTATDHTEVGTLPKMQHGTGALQVLHGGRVVRHVIYLMMCDELDALRLFAAFA